MNRLSARLAEIVDALPLRVGMRVLEIGGAPGAAAREVAKRIGPSGHIVVIDRSAKGVTLTELNAEGEIRSGLLSVRHVSVEDFELQPDERPFDLAFAVRVGALDGRHPKDGERARARIAAVLAPGGRLFIDGGDPLREVAVDTAQR
jgi:ubiquinone/menaquinone biosynthesis C-methylase UbiE